MADSDRLSDACSRHGPAELVIEMCGLGNGSVICGDVCNPDKMVAWLGNSSLNLMYDYVRLSCSRMSNTSDKGTTFGDGAARVGMQLRSSPKAEKDYDEFSKAYFSSLNLILRAGFRGCVSGGWSWLIRKSSESFSRNGRWILDCQRRIDSYSDMGLNCMMSPRCDTCKIFGHVHDYFPKKVVSPPIVATSNVVTPNAEKTNDGFQTVGKKKKRKGKSKSINGASVYWSVGLNIIVRLSFKATYKCTKEGNTYVGFITFNRTSYVEVRTGNSSKKDNLSMSNSFSSLNEEEEEGKDERSW
ncbi:hypothetical protein Tco_0669132 [Tanacetum coccineum]